MFKVTLIPGHGVGPELTQSITSIFDAAKIPITWEVMDISDLEATIASIHNTKVALKAPLETPVGHGAQSLNVHLRKTFDTYANVRPIFEIPGLKTPYTGRKLDFILVRENSEDLYIGVEYDLSPTAVESRKLTTYDGCQRICQFAFEMARSQGRSSVHCATKANILKKSEGLLKRTFEEVSKDYPDIEAHHLIIDNCAHQLMVHPEQFEVLVMSNMNGDILSDQASGLVGGLGVASSINQSNEYAIFEAVHGSAPDIAGKDLANPTAFLWSAIHLLRHLELFDKATFVENALVSTFEKGIFTKDIDPKNGLGTKAFTEQIIQHLGRKPKRWHPHPHKPLHVPESKKGSPKSLTLHGVDIYLNSAMDPVVLGQILETLVTDVGFRLDFLAHKGLTLFPTKGHRPVLEGEQLYQCRFLGDGPLTPLLEALDKEFPWVQCQKLFSHP